MSKEDRALQIAEYEESHRSAYDEPGEHPEGWPGVGSVIELTEDIEAAVEPGHPCSEKFTLDKGERWYVTGYEWGDLRTGQLGWVVELADSPDFIWAEEAYMVMDRDLVGKFEVVVSSGS